MTEAPKEPFTAVAPMPNTDPPNDNRPVTEHMIKEARRYGYARVYPIGAVTKGLKGEELAEMEEVLESLKGLSRGRLNIAVASTVNYFAPRLLAEFHKVYPGIRLKLDVTNREGLIRALATNETDLVIMGLPPQDMDLDAQSFMPNPLVVIAPPTHPLCKARDIPLQRLKGETFLVREQGSGTRSLMERVFAEKGLDPATPIEMSSTEALKQGVEAGLGLALLSMHTLDMELALKRLVVLDVHGFPVLRDWYIVHRAGKRLSVLAQAFKDFILNESKSLVTVPSPRGWNLNKHDRV